jgi:hypothetical protein
VSKFDGRANGNGAAVQCSERESQIRVGKGGGHWLHEVHCTPPPSGECFLREEEARRAAFGAALAERKDEPS